MSCSHCERVVRSELEQVVGVDSVDIDLEAKLLTVRGGSLDNAALGAAIDEAGYDAKAVAGQ